VDKSEVKKGDTIAIFGQSSPASTITIMVNSDEEHFASAKSDSDGVYLYNFDTVPLEYGDHSTRSKSAVANEISSFSKAVAFKVGTKNVGAATSSKCGGKGDVNSDCRVNLVDFSITAYWYKRALNAEFSAIEAAKLSGDGKVNIVDFSIMAFYWTG
ncbi:dockerin type I repeat-containing protein, partial [Candidatus Parcubacteria bacterium]|nr:dockerin type I repeat-containing protein [Candidatus Parcubacteria bacterium]